MTIDPTIYSIPCTGDVCKGDIILFTESVYEGSFRKPKYLGDRRVAALIVKDSYGLDKQQHTFTIRVIDSDGIQALPVNQQTTRKGRNIYRKGTWRMPWVDEALRHITLDDKHVRGDHARKEREARQERGD